MERAGAGAGEAPAAAGFSGRPDGAASAASAAGAAGAAEAEGHPPAGRCGGLELQAGWEALAEGAGAGEEKGKGEQVQVVIHLAGGEVAMGLQEARDAPEAVVEKRECAPRAGAGRFKGHPRVTSSSTHTLDVPFLRIRRWGASSAGLAWRHGGC